MLLCSVVLVLARIKVKVHGLGDDIPWWVGAIVIGVFVLIIVLSLLAEGRNKKKRSEVARMGIELARKKGCEDRPDRCWFCGSHVDGRAIEIPLNNRTAVIDNTWQVKKVPVFCCEQCQKDVKPLLVMGHPRIAPLLEGDFKIGTGKE